MYLSITTSVTNLESFFYQTFFSTKGITCINLSIFQFDMKIPTLIAGLIPTLSRSVDKNIWPSVMEIILVGIKAETFPD